VKVGDNAGGVIAVGSVVTVETGGKQKVLTILGSQQADPSSGKISYHSPIGAALIGKMAGDEASVEISAKGGSASGGNGKKIIYKILEVN
jgi:transcription elongation GreA/GreB family factor